MSHSASLFSITLLLLFWHCTCVSSSSSSSSPSSSFSSSSSSSSSSFDPLSAVDTRLGAGGFGFQAGGLPPGVQVPFGCIRLGPDTAPTLDWTWLPFQHYGGYDYNDTYIRAFSHTHTVGAGVADFGNFGVMLYKGQPQDRSERVIRTEPDSNTNNTTAKTTQTKTTAFTSRKAFLLELKQIAAGGVSPDAQSPSQSQSQQRRASLPVYLHNGYRSAFSHDNETAVPGYYAVYLDTPAAYAEMVAIDTHTAAIKFTTAANSVRTTEERRRDTQPLTDVPVQSSADATSYTYFIDVCHTIGNAKDVCINPAINIQLFNATSANTTTTGTSPLLDNLSLDFPEAVSSFITVEAYIRNRGALARRNDRVAGGGVDIWYSALTYAIDLQTNASIVPISAGCWSESTLYPSTHQCNMSMNVGGTDETTTTTTTTATATALGGYLEYSITPEQQFQLVTYSAISFISQEYANKNLQMQLQALFHKTRHSHTAFAATTTARVVDLTPLLTASSTPSPSPPPTPTPAASLTIASPDDANAAKLLEESQSTHGWSKTAASSASVFLLLPSFETILAVSQPVWRDYLSRVEIASVESESPEQVENFYSLLYHVFLSPTTYTETDQLYRGMDNLIHTWTFTHATSESESEAEAEADASPSFAPPTSVYLSDMSIWDVHRTAFPLLAIVAPFHARDIGRSLLTMYEQGGHLPRWPLASVYTDCMASANHAIVVLVDFIMKDILNGDQSTNTNTNANAHSTPSSTSASASDYSLSSILDVLLNMTQSYHAHGGRVYFPPMTNAYNFTWDDYLQRGYIPAELDEHATSTTLEYSYDDYAIAALASLLNETAVAQVYGASSLNYRNVFNASTLLMCPRSLFTPASQWTSCPSSLQALVPYPFETGYTEADALQNVWFVPHDPVGLIQLFPNTTSFVDKLANFFQQSFSWPFPYDELPNAFYWAGNEPDIFAVNLFNYAQRQDLAQYYTRAVLARRYMPPPSSAADGDGEGGDASLPHRFPGNDDYGTLSAWAVFQYLGFYPQSATHTYILNTPVFQNVRIYAPSLTQPDTPRVLNIKATPVSATPPASSPTDPSLRSTPPLAVNESLYVASVVYNHVEALTQPFITHQQLFPSTTIHNERDQTVVENVLEFYMTNIPHPTYQS